MQNSDLVMGVGQNHFIVLSAVIFSIGMIGVMMRKNVLVVLMSIELMLNAVNLAFIAFSNFNNNLNGQIAVFFVMTIAAAEAGVGLALAVMVYKKFHQLNLRFFEQLRG